METILGFINKSDVHVDIGLILYFGGLKKGRGEQGPCLCECTW